MSAALAPFDHQAVQSGASTMLKQAALAVQHVARISDAQTLGEAKIALHAAARDLIAMHPEWAEYIETRVLRAA